VPLQRVPERGPSSANKRDGDGTRTRDRLDHNQELYLPQSDWRAGATHYRWGSTGPQHVALSTGDAPTSEPEVAALLALIEELNPELLPVLLPAERLATHILLYD
jgi:hypothetical protein